MSSFLTWFNKTITSDTKLIKSDIENVTNFALLWNIFEATFWTQKSNHTAFNLSKILELVSFGEKLDNEAIDSIFNYFHSRYKDNSKFDSLNFRKNEKKLKMSW